MVPRVTVIDRLHCSSLYILSHAELGMASLVRVLLGFSVYCLFPPITNKRMHCRALSSGCDACLSAYIKGYNHVYAVTVVCCGMDRGRMHVLELCPVAVIHVLGYNYVYAVTVVCCGTGVGIDRTRALSSGCDTCLT